MRREERPNGAPSESATTTVFDSGKDTPPDDGLTDIDRAGRERLRRRGRALLLASSFTARFCHDRIEVLGFERELEEVLR